MFDSVLKRIAASMPRHWQLALKRWHYGRLLRSGRFLPDEPEYELLPFLVAKGEFVLDIGANIGHYTAILSTLVGNEGRVFAFEPIPQTFQLLTANSEYFAHRNVTFYNVAASDRFGMGRMIVPKLESGLENPYMAQLVDTDDESSITVACVPVDALQFTKRVSLVKIDAEGHDKIVLSGMRGLLERDLPTVIVEDKTKDVAMFMENLGFEGHHLPKSPNQIYTHRNSAHHKTVMNLARSS